MGYLNILLSEHWFNVFPMKKKRKKINKKGLFMVPLFFNLFNALYCIRLNCLCGSVLCNFTFLVLLWMNDAFHWILGAIICF